MYRIDYTASMKSGTLQNRYVAVIRERSIVIPSVAWFYGISAENFDCDITQNVGLNFG